MCGISGIIDKNRKPVSSELLKTVTDLIAHRGPDGEGYFFENNLALGHRRLAIIDISPAGQQPMIFDNKYVVVYNGEIFNYLEIKEFLIKKGYGFQSNSDTEVLLASYDYWQKDCVNQLNGMWSFAIFDKQKEEIFCSRDRFGIKPFYYSDLKDFFVFGSEIKQILPFFGPIMANTKILIDFLVCGLSEHTSDTFFRDIKSLPGGHNLVYSIKKNDFFIERYYNLKTDKTINNLRCIDAVNLFKKEFERSVSYRLRSDVKIGTCLSGGLDSSSIAVTAAKQRQRQEVERFLAIHARSTEMENDESQFAQKVADSSNIDLHFINPTLEDFKDSMDDVFFTQEEPFASPSVVMQYLVMKKARKMGCKVLLDGQGGDETLLGYERYYVSHLFSNGPMTFFKRFFSSTKNSKLNFLELFLYTIYFLLPNLRIFWLKKRFSFLKNEYFGSFEHVKKLSSSFLKIAKLQTIEIFETQLPHLLRYEDKNSMRNSVETRLPFLDYKLVETTFSIRESLKIRYGWTKWILRKAMTSGPFCLEDEIAWRKVKFGFEAPEKTWINAIKKDILKCIESSKILGTILRPETSIQSLDNKILWRLFSIAKWENVYQVKI